MVEKKNINDATSSIKGTLHQIYVALQEAFLLEEGECLYIEKYGDITFSGNQIEVKQYENDPLTDLHENFWKTLKNWSLPEFDISKFDTLILLTTQCIGKKSSLLKWNEATSDVKLEILKKIRSKGSENKSIIGFIDIVFQNEQRLKNILNKFILATDAPGGKALIKKIKDTRLQHILKEKQELALNGLLGFIINPTSLGEDGWSISHEAFSRECVNISEQYSNGSGIFPVHTFILSSPEIVESNFLKKLKEIDYYETVGTQAITDYFRTRETIVKESWDLGASSSLYEEYQDELVSSFDAQHRIKSRSSCLANIISDSQDLYDEVTGSEAKKFKNYINTPAYFRNGIMHTIMDEDEEKRWKLNL